jgi:hypothetical protein
MMWGNSMMGYVSLRIVHIKNDPLKRRSLSGAEGSAIELIEFMGVGFGFAHPPPISDIQGNIEWINHF